jgi:glycosyltransferase involved in cell wall biosynthesis
MVSRGNRFPAELAIECFRSQTYPNRELVIVSASKNGEVEALVASLGDPNIRFVEADPMPLGDLRNISVAAARGALLCIWDDDDLYHPRRLEVQVTELLNAGASAHFLSGVYLWWPARRILVPLADNPIEATMIARREVVPRYASAGVREDTPLLSDLKGRGTISVTNQPELYCYVVHGQNTSDPAHFEFLLGGAQNAVADYDSEITRLATFYPIDRYGSEVEMLQSALKQDGGNRWATYIEDVHNRKFKAATVRVDGVRFYNCLFEETKFIYVGGEVPVFENCEFRNVQFSLHGSAHNTLQLLLLLKNSGLVNGL